jgi:oxalate decarboxylase/phosphoglucose isomerase-like protein (cupin superfamily)
VRPGTLTDFAITGPAVAGALRVRHQAGRFVPSDDAAVHDISGQIPDRWLNAYDTGPAPDEAAPVAAVEAIERLDRVAGVVRLQHIELLPGLRQPLARLIAEGARQFTPGEHVEGISSVMYVGTATSGAALHVDLHHNLFLHLRGSKQFTLASYRDTRQQQREAAGQFGGHPEVSPDAVDTVTYNLEPGDGLYVPPYALHRVESSDATTVSIACSWATTESQRLRQLQRANGYMERLHLRSAPPGRRPAVDRIKLAALPTVDRAAGVAQRIRASS